MNKLTTVINDQKFIDQVMARMPVDANFDKLKAQFNSAFRKNMKLLDCSSLSIFESLIEAAMFNVDVSSDEAYLIPRFNKDKGSYDCDFVIDYKGILKVAYASGKIKRIEMQEIYEKDHFVYKSGTEVSVEYSPCLSDDCGAIIGAYALVELNNGAILSEVMRKADIEQCKNQAKSKSVWTNWYGEMAKKSVMHRLGKHVKRAINDPTLNAALDVVQRQLTYDDSTKKVEIQPQEESEFENLKTLISESFDNETLDIALQEYERCKINLDDSQNNQIKSLINSTQQELKNENI